MAQAKKFGTFGGVFTPSILTILGVIMYLRLPWIAGQAGLFSTIGIIMLAHLISVTTGLSVSSIATDKKVKAGGTYYMISRSLGLPIGGTLGLALFVGLSFSVSLYLIGFAESFLGYWGLMVTKNTIRIAGTAMLVLVTIVTFISTALAIKTQYFIMTAIGLSLLSIIFGQHEFVPAAPQLQPLATAAPFIALFGIFFPAVTGFEAGVSMSGDLKDPKKSIPGGTIWAIGVGLVVYIGLAFFFSYRVSAEQLVNNPNILLDISMFAPLVVAGIWGATISSALGSILGAPRILQATAQDRIAPKFFAIGFGPDNEPRNALLLTFLIAEAGILIGELDVIARIVSMFFITTYGFLNLSCAIESWASPDFRPDFRIPRIVSIIGSLACFLVMIQLDFAAMIGATVILGSVYLLLTRRQLTLESGDTWEGVWSSLVRTALHRLSRSDVHQRNWRPNIVLFSGGEQSRPHLVELGRHLVNKRGILSNFTLVENPHARTVFSKAEQVVRDNGEEEMPGVFSRRAECHDVYEAIEMIAKFYGISGVEPNTVLMGWARNTRDPRRFVHVLSTLAGLDFNILLLAHDAERGFGARKQIDVWWRGAGNNLTLALILLRFLVAADEWRQAEVRFLTVNDQDTSLSGAIEKNLTLAIEQYRFNATVKVVNNVVERRSFRELLRLESSEADLIVSGIPEVSLEQADNYVAGINALSEGLGSILLVRASSYFDDLFVGLDARLSARGDEAPDEKLSLPELVLPEPQVLREAMTRLCQRLDNTMDQYHTDWLSGGYALNRELTETMCQLVERNLDQLTRSLQEEERPRVRRTLGRAQSALLFQSQKILSEFIARDLPQQEAGLSEGYEALRLQLQTLPEAEPELLGVERAIEAFQRSKKDRLGVRWFKLRKRLRAWLARRSLTQRIRFRDLISYHVQSHYPQMLQTIWQQFALDSNQTLAKIQTLLSSARDRLVRCEKYLMENGQGDQLIKQEMDELRQDLNELREMQRRQREQARKTLLTETRKLAQTIADEALRVEVNHLLQAAYKKQTDPGAAADELLSELPAIWRRNQEHLLSIVVMQLLLLALQNRLQTIVARTKSDLHLSIENNILDKLRAVSERLQALATEPDNSASGARLLAGSEFTAFDGQETIVALLKDVRDAVDFLPESVEAISDDSLSRHEAEPFADLEVISVPLRHLAAYQIEKEFIGPLQEEVLRLPQKFQQAASVSQHMARLLSLTNRIEGNGLPEDHSVDEQLTAAINDGIERIHEAEQGVAQIQEQLNSLIDQRMKRACEQLNPYALTRSAGNLQFSVGEKKQRQVISRFAATQRKVRSWFSQQTVQLLYRRSEGVLLARRLRSLHQQPRTSVEEALSLQEVVSPDPQVIAALPFYYRQLFLGKPLITRDFQVGSAAQFAQADLAVRRYRQSGAGGLMIIGEPQAGRTTLMHLIAVRHFERQKIFQLHPPENRAFGVNTFHRSLEEALSLQGEIEHIFNRLPEQSVLLLDDLELWWERGEGGLEVIDLILDLINRYSHKCLFILSTSSFTFRFLNRLRPLGDNFIGVIECAHYDAEELKDIILLRHRSTGLKFELEGKAEEGLSDWTRARLFNSFFNYSRGNAGVALQAWISSISEVRNERLMLTAPAPPETFFLKKLKTAQLVMLAQILLHKRLTAAQLMRLMGVDNGAVESDLQLLRKAGLVIEQPGGVLALNPYVQPWLLDHLSDKEVI